MKCSLPNEQVEVRRVVEMYKHFLGRNIEQMPLLLREERSPLWAARFMRRRIDHANELPDLRSYLDVSDLIAYDSKKRSMDVKFILTVDKNGRVTEQGRKALELISPYTKLTSDYAANVDGVYDSLPGIVVARKDLGVLERDLTEKEILESKVWRILARHPDEVPAEFAENPDLLKEYAGWVKGQTTHDTNMGICLNDNSNVAKFRAFYVGRLDDGSRLLGRYILSDDGSRLVGYLAPKAQSAPVTEAGVVRTYTETDAQQAKEQLAELERFVKPESLDRVRSLIERL